MSCPYLAGAGSRPSTPSTASPTANNRRSLPAGPSSSSPTGRPLVAPSPAGNCSPGMPALLPGSVFWIKRPKFSMLLDSGVAASATRGTVGKTSASSRCFLKVSL